MVAVHGNRVRFKFYRPSARQVYLVGDFNHWQPGQLAMTQTPDGYWEATLLLPPGTFRFRYHADGQWFTDYAAFGVEPGEFGMDSLIRVGASSHSAA